MEIVKLVIINNTQTKRRNIYIFKISYTTVIRTEQLSAIGKYFSTLAVPYMIKINIYIYIYMFIKSYIILSLFSKINVPRINGLGDTAFFVQVLLKFLIIHK